MSVSFLQIYNEKVFDLLNAQSAAAINPNKTKVKGDPNIQNGLRIRWSKKEQFVVENLYVFEVNSP